MKKPYKKTISFILCLIMVMSLGVASAFAEECTHPNLTEVPVSAATCSKDGVKQAYWLCNDCGKKFSAQDASSEISEEEFTNNYLDPATNKHDYVEHAATAATCKDAGNALYYTCNTCDKIFSDENGTLYDGDPTIPAIGLGRIEEITKYGTLNDAGDTITVSGANIEFAEADPDIGRNKASWWVGVALIAPSGITDSNIEKVMYSNDMTDNLVKSFKQNNDGNTSEGNYYMQGWGSVDEDKLKKFIAEGKNMKYIWRFDWDGDNQPDQDLSLIIDLQNITMTKDDVAYLQTIDGELVIDDGVCQHPASQLVKTSAKVATCTEPGVAATYWTCKVCGKSFSDEECKTELEAVPAAVEATGHDSPLKEVAAKAQTCKVDGNIRYYYCSKCGTKFTDADGKTAVNDEAVVIKAGHSMKSTGNTSTCTVCGYSVTTATDANGTTTETVVDKDDDGKEVKTVTITNSAGKVTSKITYYADGSYYKEGFVLTLTPTTNTYRSANIVLTCNDSVVNKKSIKFEGKVMDPTYYSIADDSFKITISKDLLSQLPAGIYTVTVTTTNGDVSSTIEVLTSSTTTSPKTGDASDITLYVSLMSISLLLAAATALCIVKRKKG